MSYNYLDELAGILDTSEPTGPTGAVIVYSDRRPQSHIQLVLGRFWFDPGQVPVDDTPTATRVVGQGIVHNAYRFSPLCAAPAERRKGVGVRVDAVMALDPPAQRLAHLIKTMTVSTKLGESIIGGRYKAQPLDPYGAIDMSARAEVVVAHQHIAPVTHDWLVDHFEWYRTYCTLVDVSRTSTS